MIKKLQEDLIQLLTDVNTYEEKPNKSLSGRIRKQLGEIKKVTTAIRTELVKRDKDGYR